jgi:hypothetical protein
VVAESLDSLSTIWADCVWVIIPCIIRLDSLSDNNVFFADRSCRLPRAHAWPPGVNIGKADSEWTPCGAFVDIKICIICLKNGCRMEHTLWDVGWPAARPRLEDVNFMPKSTMQV